MQIDFVTPSFYPSVGGIEEACFQLAAGLQRRGHGVRIHTTRLRNDAPEENWHGLEIRRYQPSMRRGYYVSRFEPALEGDLIHLHAYAHHTNDWVIRNHQARVPILLSTHHGARFPKPRLSAKIYHAWYNRFVGIPNLRRLGAVLVPTAYDAEYFAAKRVESRRIHVVPSGADPRTFDAQRPWTPPGLDAPHGFFLFLGRLHAEKGVRDLLAAVPRGSLSVPVVFAGPDDGMAAEIRRAAAADPRIHLVAPLSGEQKLGLLAACRALVLPSHYEGQGMVVAEAWAQRKPVVASRAGALPSVIADEEDGLLFPVGDVDALATALNRIARDHGLAKRLGEAGRQKAEQEFQWEHILDRLVSIYDDLRAPKAPR